MATVAPHTEEAEPAIVIDEEPRSRWWSLPATTWAAVGAVLVWFVVQLGRFVDEAPDLDGMLSIRTALTAYEEGFGSLFKNAGSEGIHPPLVEFLNFAGFGLLGKDPRALHLMSFVLFALFAGGVERFLAPYLPRAGQRVLAAFTITICPALALVLFNVWREGLIMIIVVIALAVALRPSGFGARPLALGLVLALLPWTKENGIVFVAPFALYALLIDAPNLRARIIRVAYVAGLPVASELLLAAGAQAQRRGAMVDLGLLRSRRRRRSYVVALRAMFGFENGEFFRQNMANALHRQLAVAARAARDRDVDPDLPPPVAGVRAARRGAGHRLLRDLHVDDAHVPDLHRAALRDAADHADDPARVRRLEPVAATRPAGRPRRAPVRVRRRRVGTDRSGVRARSSAR